MLNIIDMASSDPQDSQKLRVQGISSLEHNEARRAGNHLGIAP